MSKATEPDTEHLSESDLIALLDTTSLPRHVAVIMDGNGRWAALRGLPRIAGHQEGVKSVRALIALFRELGIPALTIYAFSQENWKRPAAETNALMVLLEHYLQSELDALIENDVRFKAIGQVDTLPSSARQWVRKVERETARCDKLLLTVALSYGGRSEIVDAVRRLAVATLVGEGSAGAAVRIGPRVVVFAGLLFLYSVAARGGWQHGPPLRWGDAYQSPYLFANQLALNGSFTLAHAVLNSKSGDRDRMWLRMTDDGDALVTAQHLLAQPGDRLEASEQYPVLRTHHPGALPTTARIRNVVVIIMESFSAQFVGALGAAAGVTPEFDRLAREGVLFDHFFSNGTHTHQGMFASLGCFPNLPNHEYLMQQPEGRHGFSGFATLLSRRGYRTLYVYNGSFSWDNQEGFFRNQGIARFIGRDDFINPRLTSSTWGVADEDMFDRAADELSGLSGDKPFFAVLQTLSNHTPFTFPSDMPFPHYTDRGDLNERLTAFRYSDWALGRFFSKARRAPYYRDTLFVIVGDHGFGVPSQLGRIDLLRFHVPMLLIAPGLREAFGARRSVVASQVDIVPTAMALLGRPFQHQCWGRNVLALGRGDPGFAVLKPSGSSQLVAFVKGETMLTRSTGQEDQILNYRLYPRPAVAALSESQRESEQAAMRTSLDAYVHVALSSLLSNRTGIPDQPVTVRSARR